MAVAADTAMRASRAGTSSADARPWPLPTELRSSAKRCTLDVRLLPNALPSASTPERQASRRHTNLIALLIQLRPDLRERAMFPQRAPVVKDGLRGAPDMALKRVLEFQQRLALESVTLLLQAFPHGRSARERLALGGALVTRPLVAARERQSGMSAGQPRVSRVFASHAPARSRTWIYRLGGGRLIHWTTRARPLEPLRVEGKATGATRLRFRRRDF